MGGHNDNQARTIAAFGKSFERKDPTNTEPEASGAQRQTRVASPKPATPLKPNLARKIQRDHNRVQEIGRHAIAAAQAGDKAGAFRRGREALRLARLNADRIRGVRLEPLRSKLHLVAAAYALNLQRYDQALELVDRAFEGDPPAEVATDLQRLRQSVQRERVHATIGGDGDTRNGGGAGTAPGAGDSPEPGPETVTGTEPGDCEASESECEHGEPLQERDIHR